MEYYITLEPSNAGGMDYTLSVNRYAHRDPERGDEVLGTFTSLEQAMGEIVQDSRELFVHTFTVTVGHIH